MRAVPCQLMLNDHELLLRVRAARAEALLQRRVAHLERLRGERRDVEYLWAGSVKGGE
jgi:hypothetical protein